MLLTRHGRHRRADARISLIMILTFAMTLVVGAPAYAQDDPAADTEAFQATVTEARDAAQARIDKGSQVAQDGCDGLAFEACQKQFLTVQFALDAQENAAFADLLEGLDAPDVYADDVAAQVAALRDISGFLQGASTAAEAADGPLMSVALDAESDILVDLAARLSPEYARFAFLPADAGAADRTSDLAGSTPEEIAYIQGIGKVPQAAASNFDCFGRALQSSYGGTDALLGALYDCGAGTALAAIEEAGKQLTPPESFADEHAWWLAAAAEATRLDGLIGEAAREGDVVKFIANNVRLGLTQRPYRGIDRRFLAALGPASGRADLDTELGRSDYGQALFAALLDYEAVNPGRLAESLDFPQVPRDVALGAVAQLAPEFLALEADLRETLEALVPPDEFAADQALLLDFANGQRDRLEQFIEVAASGDIEATDMLHDAEHAQYCAVANELSDDVRTITAVFFDTESQNCR